MHSIRNDHHPEHWDCPDGSDIGLMGLFPLIEMRLGRRTPCLAIKAIGMNLWHKLTDMTTISYGLLTR